MPGFVLLLGLLLLPTAAALTWDVRNNTNLRYADAPGLDFKLPPGTSSHRRDSNFAGTHSSPLLERFPEGEGGGCGGVGRGAGAAQ